MNSATQLIYVYIQIFLSWLIASLSLLEPRSHGRMPALFSEQYFSIQSVPENTSISILELRSQYAYFGIRHFYANEILIAS